MLVHTSKIRSGGRSHECKRTGWRHSHSHTPRRTLGDAEEATQGTSRFLLDFNADHTAAIAQAVLADSYLDPMIEIKLPASHVGCHGLPNEVLTDYPATYFRNATCPKDAFLLAW